MLWKLLVGWLQHKHIWNLCTHDMLEASSIRWEKNEASGPPSQGPKQRRMSADRGLTVIQPHSPGGGGAQPHGYQIYAGDGKVGPYPSCIFQGERPPL